jgi:hypothetical protein
MGEYGFQGGTFRTATNGNECEVARASNIWRTFPTPMRAPLRKGFGLEMASFHW